MTLLAERPVTRPTAADFADLAPGTGGYVTLPGGRDVSAGTEGSYITVAGNRNARPRTRGSYVTVSGAPAANGSAIQGSYVTLPAV